ncbi:MAG: hypothetical protein DSZ05_05885 [Sulfurospirillum sp.]|nr:MAG: hypothetical protein DSZ05_05885 [Sulfurospirillum sp.]
MNNLILKYALIGAVLTPVGVFLAGLIGMNMAMGYLSAAIAGVVGGAMGGWLRQRAGKND